MTSSSAHPKLRIATVGLGNWAGQVVDLLLKQHDAGESEFELVAACEPNLALNSVRVAALEARGIKVVTRYDQILDMNHVDAVVLPIPIHLHRPMTEQALAAGKAVLVEKPAAGSVQDVDAMIIARDQAKLPVLVSFQDTYDPALLELKRIILSGEIGAIRSASVVGCWPRDEAYYARTFWSGKIRHSESWVLDSPASNAFAHYLHLTLFLLGTAEQSWAEPQSVEAELYRAYPIENYDTASLRVIASGVPILTLLTHACVQSIGPLVAIQGQHGSIQIDLIDRTVEIRSTKNPRRMHLHAEPRRLVLPAFANYLRGLPVNAGVSTLEAARNHVVAVNGASQAAIVKSLDLDAYVVSSGAGGERARSISGIEPLLLKCAASGQKIHESGEATWSVPAGRISVVGYREFTGCPQRSSFVEDLTSPLRARAGAAQLSAVSSVTRNSV